MTTLTLEQNVRIATDPAILMKQKNMLRSKLIMYKKHNGIWENVIPGVTDKSTLRKEICNAFGIPEENLFLKCRKREIVNARQIYVYLIRTTELEDEVSVQKVKRKSPSALAKHIGFDHATIYHCESKTQDYYDTEADTRALIDRLQADLISGKIPMPFIEA